MFRKIIKISQIKARFLLVMILWLKEKKRLTQSYKKLLNNLNHWEKSFCVSMNSMKSINGKITSWSNNLKDSKFKLTSFFAKWIKIITNWRPNSNKDYKILRSTKNCSWNSKIFLEYREITKNRKPNGMNKLKVVCCRNQTFLQGMINWKASLIWKKNLKVNLDGNSIESSNLWLINRMNGKIFSRK